MEDSGIETFAVTDKIIARDTETKLTDIADKLDDIDIRVRRLTDTIDRMAAILDKFAPIADKIPADIPNPPPGLFGGGFPAFPSKRG
jgi:hypothetical protein